MNEYVPFLLISLIIMSACHKNTNFEVTAYETSASGKKLDLIEPLQSKAAEIIIDIDTAKRHQRITGFGGSFTESTSYLLQNLSAEKRKLILEAYFSESGARYSLARTHINSCDFSLSQYSYAPVVGDKELTHFSVDEDRDDIIPTILEAKRYSADGFKIISSPWTAPPWMKDNNNWVGGKLLKDYYPTWSLFFLKYLQAYRSEGIDIWGLTVENEPLGNGNNWESMHFTPEEMTEFVVNYLGPILENSDFKNVKILGYDQNRAELRKWVDVMYANEESTKYYGGTAIHWYESTYEVFPENLQYTHSKAPQKHLIQTEACVDAEIPRWQEDDWYWQPESTDWGWDWAQEDQKYLHPKYVPTFRYARDIIGCLNNWVDGWVDWNMVLNKQGGPNWFKNWCVAPVIVDIASDEVYFTPIYYIMSHFSKFIRPQAQVVGVSCSDESLLVTATQNIDNSIVAVLLNQSETPKTFNLRLNGFQKSFSIDSKAIQTIILTQNK